MKIKLAPLVAAISVMLTACGGGVDTEPTERTTVALSDADIDAQPAFHRTPIELDAPAPGGTPTEIRVSSDLMRINTARMVDTVDLRRQALAAGSASTTSTIYVHTPAQIRAAYGLKPIDQSTPAELGAGQTIYIITAYHAPNLLKDLATFNAQFNLPGCREVRIPTTTKIIDTLNGNGQQLAANAAPLLPPAPTDGCTISVVNPRFLTLNTVPPAYDRIWALETTLDVQWAHATAPLARIVVLQSLNNFVNSFANSLTIANQFGPGAVSMSFVAGENPVYTERYEYFLNGPGMTYFAASGDWGSLASWPATSPSVIAVGGTSLKLAPGGRTETAWSKTGGGYSAYFAAPDYQAGVTAGAPLTGRHSTRRGMPARASSDVAFNADPYTGQYVVFTPQGGRPSWYSMGGTSIGSPQWAGFAAIINAKRAAAGLAPLGKFHRQLYSTYGPSIGAYAQTFTDIQQGSNGTCSNCTAGTGWDLPTGWGTPNVSYLIDNLSR